MNRRDFLRLLGGTAVACGAMPVCAAESATTRRTAISALLTPVKEIQEQVNAARPSLGGAIPADLPQRLGTTHYNGLYCFTKEPYLIEGCKAIEKLGMRIAKLWFANQLPGYAFNSDWKLTRDLCLADVAKHPYFQQAFAMPFSTFVLEIQPVRGGKFDKNADFSADERQFFELTSHLLQNYRDRDVTFIVQHWEGDWMLRGSFSDWKDGPPEGVEERCGAFVRWLSARQNGVARAREQAGQTRCRVYHAAEVNRVLDALKGLPTLITHVLPHVAVDWVSWSSYDGMGSAANFWHGLDLIRHYAKPASGLKEPRVYIGEIGLPEQERKEADVLAFWDMAMGVLLARQIPYIVQWELYCNEPARNRKNNRPARSAEDCRGFWLIRPDGSYGIAAKYLMSLIENAGGKLPSK